MSIRKDPEKVKLFFSVFANSEKQLLEALNKLTNLYGEIDWETDVIPFDQTNYYEKEFGKDLKRKLFSFKDLILPSEIVDIKLMTYELEAVFSRHGKRNVNIDPGYVTLSRVVLSTGKDYTHRIYLNCIRGELWAIPSVDLWARF